MKRGQLSTTALALSSVAAVAVVIHLGARYIIIASAISPQRRSFCARLPRARISVAALQYNVPPPQLFGYSVFHQTSVNASCHLGGSYILYYIILLLYSSLQLLFGTALYSVPTRLFHS